MTLPLVICTTILIEKSPKAIPLGAACVASALKHDSRTKSKCETILTWTTFEDSDYRVAKSENSVGLFLTNKILSGKNSSSLNCTLNDKELPIAVCFSVYVWNRREIELTCSEIKKHYPQIVCIAGGPEITADPLGATVFDYTIAGEGENVLPIIIESILNGKKVENLSGVYSPKNNAQNSIPNVQRALSCDLEKLESPWLDGTIDPSNYDGALWELARGCPFKCSYCYESKGEKKVRYFSKERLEKELDLFAMKKVPQVFILDPTYNADKKRAIEMLHLIKEKAPNMFCYFEARAEFIDNELAKAFTQISCSLQIGLQSMHENVLLKVNRSLNKKLFVKNIGILNKVGVVFGFDLIYGLPEDSLAGFRESIDFALSLYPNNLELFCLSVLPGTDLFTKAKEYQLEWQENPPYNVIKTNKFTPDDMLKAEQLSLACSLFYNQGRAVAWFYNVIRPLKIKPSMFFADFALFRGENLKKETEACICHKNIEQIQIDFIKKKYHEKHLDVLLPAVCDIIKLNGALSRTLVTGSSEIIKLHYDSDNLMSEYALDIQFFVKNVRQRQCSAKTFMTKVGVDWCNV